MCKYLTNIHNTIKGIISEMSVENAICHGNMMLWTHSTHAKIAISTQNTKIQKGTILIYYQYIHTC